jgi:hypothetical protein
MYQSIGGEELHIEAMRMGNTIQVWTSDGRHITHMMFDLDQASTMARKIVEALTFEETDE